MRRDANSSLLPCCKWTNERGVVVPDVVRSNRELNERLLHGREVSVVSSQDGVRVQFTTDRVAAVSFEGRLAFRLPLPDTIMKLQRREYYRLRHTGGASPQVRDRRAGRQALSLPWPTSAWAGCAWWGSR